MADVVWIWSEFEGKYEGCRYWSEGALEARRTNKPIVHEHLVPKRVIIDLLMSIRNPTAGAIRDLLDRFCVGVVVSQEEDRKLNSCRLRSTMPQGWTVNDDPWARHIRAGIKSKQMASAPQAVRKARGMTSGSIRGRIEPSALQPQGASQSIATKP
jgi:hypothetical protein